MLGAYLGEDQDSPPPLPELEFKMVPAENVHVSFQAQECNWLQALEGKINSAHAPILHGRIDQKVAINDWVAAQDLGPKFKCVKQPFGVSIASRRRIDEYMRCWRAN